MRGAGVTPAPRSTFGGPFTRDPRPGPGRRLRRSAAGGGVETRVDARYFALATLTTVGYGDVSAQGQVARAVVCGQLVFSIGVVATGASVLVKQLTGRLRPGRR